MLDYDSAPEAAERPWVLTATINGQVVMAARGKSHLPLIPLIGRVLDYFYDLAFD